MQLELLALILIESLWNFIHILGIYIVFFKVCYIQIFNAVVFAMRFKEVNFSFLDLICQILNILPWDKLQFMARAMLVIDTFIRKTF